VHELAIAYGDTVERKVTFLCGHDSRARQNPTFLDSSAPGMFALCLLWISLSLAIPPATRPARTDLWV